MPRYDALFQPGRIGSLQLKNRLIMPAMGTALADAEGRVTDRLIAYYRARAAGGAALITPQFAAVSPDSVLPYTMSICEDDCIADWRKVVEGAHEAGVAICVQLMHTGLILLYSEYIPEGASIPVPSMMPWLPRDKPYRVLTEEDIDGYVEDFVRAAVRAREAGADAVELHACHGCLVSSFLSPVTNCRTDQYGGSAENRALFARRIIERLKGELGSGFPVWVRMNASDDMPGGISIGEAVQQAMILEAAGSDAISVSGGLEYWSTLSIPTYPYPKGPMVPLAERIKQAVKVPVVAAGKIDAELAAQVLHEGKADFIAIGRPLLADPELPNKVREGRIEDVRRCIYCNNCLKSDPNAGPGPCSVNPYLYREARYPPPPAKTPKKVLVVGGGLGGMQTAAYLAERGHQVHLYEKKPRLGGQWNVACATPGKEGYAVFGEYLQHLLKKYEVTVTLGTEVTRDMVTELEPDAVVVATGAVPVGLGVPGIDLEMVVQGHDVIEGRVKPRGKTVVVGGRFIGMEVAIWLREQGEDVSLITRAGLGENGIRLEKLTFKTLADKLVEMRVPLYLHATVLEITHQAVIFTMGNELYSLPADTVILAVGMRSEDRLARELEGTDLEIHMVGDCVRPRDAAEVAYQAMRVAAKI